MGVQGPIARSAEDLELALSVLAGPEVGEDVAWRVELAGGAARAARRVSRRRAAPDSLDRAGRPDRVRARGCGGAPRQAGMRGRGACSPRSRRLEGALSPLPHAPRHDDERADAGESAGSRFSDGTGGATTSSRGRARAGSRRRPGDYLLWIARREQYRAAWREFFREWDVLLAPAFSTARLSARRAAVSLGRERLHADARDQRPAGAVTCAASSTRPSPPSRASRRPRFLSDARARLADRFAGDRPVSRGPDADRVRGAAGEGDRRFHEAGRLRGMMGCGRGSWGARRPSLADYVIGTGATRGATAAGGASVGYPLVITKDSKAGKFNPASGCQSRRHAIQGSGSMRSGA